MNVNENVVGADAMRREIDRELDLVLGAARLVRTGVASRVTVANLPLALAILQAARTAAAPLGARIEVTPADAERPLALIIEAAGG